MAISGTYCTEQDIIDVYPNIDEYDSKTPIYGWGSVITIGSNSHYTAYNTGKVDTLFLDGQNRAVSKQVSTQLSGVLNGDLNDSATSFLVTSTTGIPNPGYIQVDNEIMIVTAILGSGVTVSRGAHGTDIASHSTGSKIKSLYDITTNSWYYDETNDFLMLNHSTNPQNVNVETGTDWSSLLTRVIKNASRYFDSRVDASLPRDQWKDKEGNYDYIVVRTTALISAYFLINSSNPGSELALQFMDEVNFNIDQLNTGKSKLSNQVSSDASSGVLREVVSPQNANPLHIVDTRGSYNGSYDLLKIVITTSGVVGTAKFSVFQKGADTLKTEQVVKEKIINGQYQSIGNGLQIRFQGKDASSEATAGGTPDEWELECWGILESFDGSPGSPGNTRMTRKAPRVRF